MNIGSEIDSILKDFGSISLEEVQKASLLKRKDRKYLFCFSHLPEVLGRVMEEYRVLEIEEKRSHEYSTFYYDTSDLDMYHMHHRGRANRHKLRFRKYGTSGSYFLEVKKKDAKGITSKKRIPTEGMDASILEQKEEFLNTNTPYQLDGMAMRLENGFNRITLVNHNQTERITLDYQLRFSGNGSGVELALPGISIAEIKFASHLSGSPFHYALRQSKITPRRFSKYAIGMALVNPELKQNRFKEKVLRVHKINRNCIQLNKQNQHA